MVSKYDVQGEYKAVEGKQYGFVNKVGLPFMFCRVQYLCVSLFYTVYPFASTNPFQNFAKFMDVYHSSTTGIFDRREGTNPFVGHLDVWLNGGLGGVPDLNANQHKSAVYFFASTILGYCA